ncbi:alpha/beta hydrolase [Flagellimonas zhangzhouensis]|uniref:Pimeloyl-ACP methyl ester carboxylesterase n=1 Tax=Flagellimonas zhangzhouensis TaxID=1073328 RepID=A0A1H2QAC4_9FLAO|nr:alpha/beta hydrolase [Allomuricauda zhangzhouensis]SDQ50250.1 Pimeloyl-ACP methyl ester carboxylesterase [Allomuricauda zhangzhouensis]SDW03634.1 Pimeloyl-ACP methyl ester carboxylesterase [Allomuricauda zhangzhouensis]
MKKLLTKIMPLAYGQYFNVYSLVAPKKMADKAFHVFCTVRKGRVKPEQSEYLDGAKLTVEEVAGHKIQSYHWPGNKETVLLVHGWESNTYRWRNLIKKLREADFNIIAFDAPSHGYSSGKHLYVPLYEEAVNHMVKKYNPQHLIGHSVGGMTIMYNQYKNPSDHVQKMVTIGSPSEFHEIIQTYQDILKFNNRVMKHLDHYIYDRFGFKIDEFSTSRFAQSISKKGLLFHDKLDNITPYHASVKVNKNWRGSELVSTEGFGHSMHQEDVNNQIITFLEAK